MGDPEIEFLAGQFGVEASAIQKCLKKTAKLTSLPRGEVLKIVLNAASRKFDDMPPEIIYKIIFENLSGPDILRLCQTSKAFGHLCKERETWMTLLRRDFGITRSRNPKKEYLNLMKDDLLYLVKTKPNEWRQTIEQKWKDRTLTFKGALLQPAIAAILRQSGPIPKLLKIPQGMFWKEPQIERRNVRPTALVYDPKKELLLMGLFNEYSNTLYIISLGPPKRGTGIVPTKDPILVYTLPGQFQAFTDELYGPERENVIISMAPGAGY